MVLTAFRYNRTYFEHHTDPVSLPDLTHLPQKYHVNDRVLLLQSDAMTYFKEFVPANVFPVLKCTNIVPTKYFRWWRSVGITFFLRPNAKSMEWLEANRDKELIEKHNGRCISTYVRHGDKAIEMKLVPFSDYAAAAEAAWKKDSKLPRVFYLSTEDVHVFDEAKAWAKKKKIELRYTKVLADKMEYIRKHGDKQYGRVESSYEYLSYMLTVADATSCEVHIATLSSNFNRIIDEFRTTIAEKGDKLLIDLSVETCKKPPCFNYFGMGNHPPDAYNPGPDWIMWR